jgi:hypothetical protein
MGGSPFIRIHWLYNEELMRRAVTLFVDRVLAGTFCPGNDTPIIFHSAKIAEKIRRRIMADNCNGETKIATVFYHTQGGTGSVTYYKQDGTLNTAVSCEFNKMHKLRRITHWLS